MTGMSVFDGDVGGVLVWKPTSKRYSHVYKTHVSAACYSTQKEPRIHEAHGDQSWADGAEVAPLAGAKAPHRSVDSD